MKIFSFLTRWSDHTEVMQYKKTKTGEYVPHVPTLSVHEVNRMKTGRGQETGVTQGSTRRWFGHTRPRTGGHNDG